MINILLLKDFYNPLPISFIDYLQIHCPEACCLTVKEIYDFNIWDKNLRNNSKLLSSIKLYEKEYSSLNEFFKIETIPYFNGNILIDTVTHEEFWEYNVRQDKSSIYSKT